VGHPRASGGPDAGPGATPQPAISFRAAGQASDDRAAGTASDDKEPDPLGQLEARYPRWRIWRGRASGNLWAMPPRGHPTHHDLISARNAGELAKRLADAEQRAG
jgi:hypothetical protein